MRKTNGIFVVLFFSITYEKSWRYNAKNRQILNSKS